LGALDEKLRLDMQVELVGLHKQLGMTFVYITHSQEEALTMSDRVVLMRRGRIEQAGPPPALFDRPVSRFTAEFMGVENVLEGEVERVAAPAIEVRVGPILVRGRWCGEGAAAVGQRVAIGIRAERMRLAGPLRPGTSGNVVPCRTTDAIYKGKYLDQSLETPIGILKARLWDTETPPAEIASVSWSEEHAAVMQI
jgi:ABC-type Fe3+/spermidine/putrescine transport system ATPase subunit